MALVDLAYEVRPARLTADGVPDKRCSRTGVVKQCEQCGVSFYVPPRSAKVRRFCNRNCFNDFQKKPRSEAECKTCGKKFGRYNPDLNKEYCSAYCIPRGDCLICGKPIHRAHPGDAAQVCDGTCSGVYHRTIKGKTRYVARGYAATIIRIGKIACERCGNDNIWCLTVHHKDRDRKNNESYNLETLCANCHAIEHYEGSAVRERWVETAVALANHPNFAASVTE